MQFAKRVLDADAAGEQTMVAQDKDVAVAQISDQPLLLVQIQGHAFVVVVGHAAVVGQGVLGDRQQTVTLGRNRGSIAGMGVQHGGEVWAGAVDGAVDHIACLVDAQARWVVDERTVHIDLDQVRGGDLVEQQAERIDQEMLVRPRAARAPGRRSACRYDRSSETGRPGGRQQPA